MTGVLTLLCPHHEASGIPALNFDLFEHSWILAPDTLPIWHKGVAEQMESNPWF